MDRRLALSTVLAGLPSLFTSAALSQTRVTTPKTLLLGHCAAFTGPFADLGNQFHLGARLVFDALNQSGGVHGFGIDLRKVDDAFDADRTMANVMTLAGEQVFALFGLMGANNVSAALRFSEAEGIPLFAPMTGSPDLRREYSKHLIHVRASYEDELDRIFAHLKLIGVKKVSLVIEEGAYDQAGFEGVRQILRNHIEGDFTSRLLLARGDSDVSGDKVGHLLASSPDVIVFLAGYKAAARMIRLARQRRFTGNFFTVSSVGARSLLDELGAVAEGVAVSQVMPFPYAVTSKISSEFLQSVQAKQGMRPSYAAMEGYVAARVFVEALLRVGPNPTRDRFIGAIQAMQRFDLGGFLLDYGPSRNTGSRFVELTMLTRDGRIRR